jgi:hypothetical protein
MIDALRGVESEDAWLLDSTRMLFHHDARLRRGAAREILAVVPARDAGHGDALDPFHPDRVAHHQAALGAASRGGSAVLAVWENAQHDHRIGAASAPGAGA